MVRKIKKGCSNKEIAEVLHNIAELLDIKGVRFKPSAYQRAADAIRDLHNRVVSIYKKGGIKGLQKIKGVGKSIASEIEEYLKKGKIKRYEDLKEETAIRQVVTHYFKTKGISLDRLKKDARKHKIVYSRYVRPAKDLLELAGSVEKAQEAIDKVAEWANSRGLDYVIETVFKKWLELDRLKPKKKKMKAYYDDQPMQWSKQRKKWYVISDTGEWLEFAGKEEEIEWREE